MSVSFNKILTSPQTVAMLAPAVESLAWPGSGAQRLAQATGQQAQARIIAEEQKKAEEEEKKGKTKGGLMGLGGAGGGTLLGAGIGTLVAPGIGTVIGAGLGGSIGGSVGTFGAGMAGYDQGMASQGANTVNGITNTISSAAMMGMSGGGMGGMGGDPLAKAALGGGGGGAASQANAMSSMPGGAPAPGMPSGYGSKIQLPALDYDASGNYVGMPAYRPTGY